MLENMNLSVCRKKKNGGILVRKDSELAVKEGSKPKDLASVPLIMVKCELVKNELDSWFGTALCFDLGAAFYEDLCLVPLAPILETGAVFVWKKNQMLGAAASQSMQFLKNAL